MHGPFISEGPLFLYDFDMEELMKQLENIGFLPRIRERIQRRYEGDEEGLRRYVRFCVALFGHEHERMGRVQQ